MNHFDVQLWGINIILKQLKGQNTINMAAIKEETPPNCPICLEGITDVNTATTLCGHNFHCNCLIEHAVNAKTGCPICREKLPGRKKRNTMPLNPDLQNIELHTDILTITVGDEMIEVRPQMIHGLQRLVRIGPLGGAVYTLDTHIEVGFYNTFANEFYHLIETIVTLNGRSECVRRINLNGIERYVSEEAPHIVYNMDTLEEVEYIDELSAIHAHTPQHDQTLDDIIAHLD